MSNIYMDYLTESEKELLILEKECEREIMDYESNLMSEASLYLKGYHGKYQRVKLEYEKLADSAKKNLKKGNYEDAKKDINKAKKILNDLKTEISNTDTGVISTMVDNLIPIIPFIMLRTAAVAIAPGSAFANMASYLEGLVKLGGTLKQGASILKKKLKEYRNNDKVKDLQIEDFNSLKSYTLDGLDECIKACDSIIKAIDNAERNGSK